MTRRKAVGAVYTEPERHHNELIKSIRGNKSRIFSITLVELSLPIPTVQVY